MFVRDAKMALGSHLLKHYVISKLHGVPWRETTITRDAKTKPVYVDPATGRQPVSFNVSHQAGLVALVAVAGYHPEGGAVDVGVDVVCVSERRDRDHRMVADEGWPAYVDMHADVFAPGEAEYLKYRVLSVAPGGALSAGSSSAEAVLDFKLRCFYTLWCLREAYVKMTGEALLAEWLRELEFRAFLPPVAAAATATTTETAEGKEEAQGVAVKVEDVWFKGQKVEDANVCIRSWGSDYMTCTAVRTPGHPADGLAFELGPYEMLSMEEVLSFAESVL